MSKKLIRRWIFLMILLAFFMFQAALAEETTHVVILGTSDMHGNVWSWSYEDGAETSNNGMPRLYTYIQQVRAENPLTFLIDGGDAIQGTILTDDIANKNPETPHPVIAAMNVMGYDAMTLGNHDFNWGIPTLLQILSTARFPVLAENVRNADGHMLTGAGWTLIDRGGVKLAVIGVVTPMIPIWDGGKEGIDEYSYQAAGEAVRHAIAEIGDQADIIMVSAHMGLDGELDMNGGSDVARKILEDNPEVDVLQVAHMHITVNEKVGRVPVGGVRNSGREIARFDLTLDEQGNILHSEVSIIDMADYEPDETIREIPAVRLAHDQAIQLAGVSGGEDEENKDVIVGYTTSAFQPPNEIRGIPSGRLMDTAVVDLILKVELEKSGADVVSAQLFRDKADLAEGPVYYRDIFRLYKYDNTLCRMTVTGAELKRYMEWAAAGYNQWKPGDINISFDPDVPSYLQDQFDGVCYEVNLSKPRGERIENVFFHDHPLKDDDVLTLAVNNYRYASAIKAENIAAGTPEWESSGFIRDMIISYLGEHSPVEPEIDNNWRITGIDLSPEDPRRAVLIQYINEGLLPTPYYQSYNLADYDSLVALAEENRENGIILSEREYSH